MSTAHTLSPGAVRAEVAGQALVITINRPHARNAVNAAVAAGIADAVDRLEDEPALRVGILTGAQGTFSAGMDLKAAMTGESPDVVGRGFGGLARAETTKPLIAAVEGWALGGGFELALACDLIVAAENARFGLPEVRRGLLAAGGGAIRLTRRVPHHLAMELLLTGEPVTAERAERLGLVNRLAAPGDALATALELADRLAANAPLALAAVKRIVRATEGTAEDTGFETQQRTVAQLFASADAREGLVAFAEHRDPVWQGR